MPGQHPYGFNPPPLPPRPGSAMGNTPYQQGTPYNPQSYGGPPPPMNFAPPPGAPTKPEQPTKLFSSKTVKKLVNQTTNIINETITPILNGQDPRFKTYQGAYAGYPVQQGQYPQGQYQQYQQYPPQGQAGGPVPMQGKKQTWSRVSRYVANSIIQVNTLDTPLFGRRERHPKIQRGKQSHKTRPSKHLEAGMRVSEKRVRASIVLGMWRTSNIRRESS